MYSSKPSRLSLLFICLPLVLAISALEINAQAKLELALCEDIKITETKSGIAVVETATCVKPTTNFKPKGTLRNVFAVATFPAVPTGASVMWKVTKNDADGGYVEDQPYAVSPRHTTAYMRLTINTPGKYFVRMVNYYIPTQVWASAAFTVGEDTVGARATGNTAAGGGKVSVCKEIDDDWKCVGESNEWKANTNFNVLFENPTPVGVDFIGIVFYKRGADGKDIDFINEYQQNIGETNRKYATVGEMLRLPAGVYSVYIISWGKRELMMKNGNLKEYFAKTVLTVK